MDIMKIIGLFAAGYFLVGIAVYYIFFNRFAMRAGGKDILLPIVVLFWPLFLALLLILTLIAFARGVLTLLIKTKNR